MSEPRKRPPSEAYEAAAQDEAPRAFHITEFRSEITHRPRKGEGKPKVHDLAARVLAEDAWMSDASGGIFRFVGTHWEHSNQNQIRAKALSLDDEEATSIARRREVAEQVALQTFRQEIPWRRMAENEVPCLNGVVNVDTSEIRPHRKEDYLEAVIPWDYDPRAKHPIWTKVVADYFAENIEKIAALQEFFGYILMPHARYKRALFLQGQSNTGKSVIVQVIQDLVGPGNYCSIPTQHMGDARKQCSIVGKMVNLVTELPADALIEDGGFKQLVSTGDPIQIDPKWRDAFSYAPFCKHVIACNTMPTMNDHTRATVNRLLILNFNRVFAPHEQNRALREQLIGEMPGILAWAVEGAAALIARGGEFTDIPDSEKIIEKYRFESNPIQVFLKEEAVEVPSGRIPMRLLRERLYQWSRKAYTVRGITNMLDGAGLVVREDSWQGQECTCIIGWQLRG